MTGTKDLKFLSWNVNGLKSKIVEVKSELRRLEPDVVFLQEIRMGKSTQITMSNDYHFYHTTYSSRFRGTAVLVKKDKVLKKDEPVVERDNNGCYVLVQCNLSGVEYSLLSVYSAKGDARLLSNLEDTLKSTERVLVVGGDFNTALEPKNDCINRQRKDTKPRQNLRRFTNVLNLQDTWRVCNPDKKDYTYVVKSRLDYIFVPKNDSLSIKKCEILNFNISDHKPDAHGCQIWTLNPTMELKKYNRKERECSKSNRF
ncbi:hypothetical protein NFI96_002640 [Prochilodus magdalenae]|nr:hypothetical protein NFI96_002640 [Prochilodus magdalenae]